MSAHFSWQSAVVDSSLEPTTKLVLLVIGTHMNMHGKGAFPSYATIAAGTSLNRATVIRHVDVAIRQGWLTKQERMRPAGAGGKPERDSNLYAISYPVVAQGDQVGAMVAPDDHPDRAGPPPVVAQGNPNTPALTPQGTPQDSCADIEVRVVRKAAPGEDAFSIAWARYPKRAGGNSKANALKAWNARVSAGVDPQAMLAGVQRYAEFCRVTGKLKTEYVKQASTFFGPAEHYLEDWTPPARASGHSRDFTGLDYDAPEGFRSA
jgi:hypothetical protein